MAVFTNFEFVQFNDGVLVVSLNPPQAIGDWDISFAVTKRFGGTDDVILKSIGSGIANGVSGITITNSGAGVFQVALNSVDTSGLSLSNYSYTAERTNSGRVTALALGFLILLPA